MLLLLAVLLVVPPVLAGAAQAPLSKYTIVLAADASKEEAYAAGVLQTWTSAIAGSTLPIIVLAKQAPPPHAGHTAALLVGYGVASALNSSAVLPLLHGLGREGSLLLAYGPAAAEQRCNSHRGIYKKKTVMTTRKSTVT